MNDTHDGPTRGKASKSLRFGLAIAVLTALAVGGIFFFQVRAEQRRAEDELVRRAQLLAYRTKDRALGALERADADAATALGDRLEGHSQLLGLSLWRADGRMIASGRGVSDYELLARDVVASAVESRSERREMIRTSAALTHLHVSPLYGADGMPVGALAVLQDAAFVEDRTTRGMVVALVTALAVAGGMLLITTGLAWALFERPLELLADWMRRLRFGNTPEQPPRNIPVGKLADETVHLAASFRAARAQERDEARDIVRNDKAWTRERLRAYAIDALGGQPLVVVSNREPYMHVYKDGVPVVQRPASGLVTGLDPVLRACGGLWVAHGAGNADKRVSDAKGCVPVPPEDPRYTLRRVWITKEEEQGYYYGFSNEGLWPLCHLTHERPVFRAADWEQYVRANQRFANAVIEEIGSEKAVVMVQDYQLALVPGMIKAKRPDLRVGLFWHIPWPNPESFRICPYRVEILRGMLGADLIGFHLQQHCNNFLDTVDRMVEAKLDWDRFSAELQGHTALVRPFPISVQSWSEREVARGQPLQEQMERLRKEHQLEGVVIGVGVDRIDYTKGIAERFRAIERFFEANPQQRGKFTFVQLGAPSRTHIPRYRDLVTDLEQIADAINWKFQTESWKPIRFLVDHHDAARVYAFLRMSRVCIVSSLHDGMNLVAKEYIAAQGEGSGESPEAGGDGVLVLSEFAGAARDLPEALIVNPYDTEEFAAAIAQAMDMDPKERRHRMMRMRLRVEEFNIYRWAGDFLTALAEPRQSSSSSLAPAAAK